MLHRHRPRTGWAQTFVFSVFCSSSSSRQRINSDSAASEALMHSSTPVISKLTRWVSFCYSIIIYTHFVPSGGGVGGCLVVPQSPAHTGWKQSKSNCRTHTNTHTTFISPVGLNMHDVGLSEEMRMAETKIWFHILLALKWQPKNKTKKQNKHWNSSFLIDIMNKICIWVLWAGLCILSIWWFHPIHFSYYNRLRNAV